MTQTAPHHHLWKESAHQHFQKWAQHYDRDIIHILLFEPCYRRVLCQLRHWGRRGIRDLKILDIGTGTGTLPARCARMPAVVTSAVGLDMSENMIKNAQRKADELQLNHALRFVVGDAEHLPFDDNSFDLVTCCNSFHHYPDQLRALREMHRVLTPQGRLMLLDGCRDDPLGFVIFDFAVARAESHVHHCSAGRFRRLITQAGFGKLNQQVFNVCPPVIMNLAHK